MKSILYVILIVLGFVNLNAQRGQSNENGKLEHLKSSLDLTDEQSEKIEQIFKNAHEQRKEGSRSESRETIQKEIEGVLSDEQLVKFAEIKQSNGRRGRRGHAMKTQRKKAFTKDEEVQEKLQEMRQELEEGISEEDRQTIDELRIAFVERKESFKGKKADFRSLSDDEKKTLKEELKASKAEMKEDRETLKGLVEKYKTDIEHIFTENETFFAEKKEEAKEEWKAKKEEWKEKKQNGESIEKEERVKGSKANKGRTSQRHRARGKKLPKHASFLLLDPYKDESESGYLIKDVNSISISPNPASTNANISYEVKQAGLIRVEIRDESGRVHEVITNEVLESGTYTKSIEISKYQDKTYYISISDGHTIQTEKLLIQK